MKHRLGWQRVPREALAQHLREVDVLASEAVGETSIYHCRGKDGESMAIALPGGNGLLVTLKAIASPALERRRRRAVGTTEPPRE